MATSGAKSLFFSLHPLEILVVTLLPPLPIEASERRFRSASSGLGKKDRDIYLFPPPPFFFSFLPPFSDRCERSDFYCFLFFFSFFFFSEVSRSRPISASGCAAFPCARRQRRHIFPPFFPPPNQARPPFPSFPSPSPIARKSEVSIRSSLHRSKTPLASRKASFLSSFGGFSWGGAVVFFFFFVGFFFWGGFAHKNVH